ncbi:glycosyltransferase [Terriglobus albidus]|uniref:glycosyltransferase n=1 Tax=Terriglobus albidus TaxID=1592106 RepID=UPI0021DF98FD|nr:glycosyltransferase [Terriglobus albidus]
MPNVQLYAPSIVLEWENVKASGIARVTRALGEVSLQLKEVQNELRGPAELIVCYEECVISGMALRSLLERAAAPGGWQCSVITVPVPSGTHYYEKKNAGARASSNDIVLFLDSDLLPDPGWLRNMLTVFNDWSVSAIIGATHLDHATPYEMAVALFWIFDPATHGRGIQPLRLITANNLAFRRALFMRFPYPSHPVFRGQCGHHAKTLMAAGILLERHTDARASHPPPAGFAGFIRRAWAAGKDECFYQSLERRVSPMSAFRQWQHDLGVVRRRMQERCILLRPTPVGQALGWLLGWVYYSIKAAGFLTSASCRETKTAGQRLTV